MSSRRNTDPEVDPVELRALLQLRLMPGLDDQRLNFLLSRYHPKFILEHATPGELGERAWRARTTRSLADKADRALRMIERLRVGVLSSRSGAYPATLRRLGEFAPPLLFCRGRDDLFERSSLAIIGARDSTEYGDSVAEMLAGELAERGVVVVSGLARGIDAVAHRSALAAGGSTIAVLGCGIDVAYPPCNTRLQERIAEEGLLISEFAPGSPAYPSNFPKRNRLIALLGNGVLVIEAGPKSGTRKTVDWALNYGMPVLAVPGPIGRYESQGTNEIIRDGGRLVMSVHDVLEELGWTDLKPPDLTQREAAVPVLAEAAERIYQQLTLSGQHVDAIARRCGLGPADALTLLMQLELDGHVRQYPGKRFSRVPPGQAGRRH